MTMPLVSGYESYSSTARRLARFASAFVISLRILIEISPLAAQKPTSILEERG
jgi:hypothetical protein